LLGKDGSMNTPTRHLAVALLAASAFQTHSRLGTTSTHTSANAVAVIIFAVLLAIGIASALALLDGARSLRPPSD
jgi:hypothetical protein